MQTSRTITSPALGVTSAIVALLFFIFIPYGVQGVSLADVPSEYLILSVTNTLIAITMLHGLTMRNLGINSPEENAPVPPLAGIIGIGIGSILQFNSLLYFIPGGLFVLLILFVLHIGFLLTCIAGQIALIIYGKVPYDRYLVRGGDGPQGSSRKEVYKPGMRVWPGLMNSKNLNVIPRYLDISVHKTIERAGTTYTADLYLLAELEFSEQTVQNLWTLIDRDFEDLVHTLMQESLGHALKNNRDPQNVLSSFVMKAKSSADQIHWNTKIVEILSSEIKSETKTQSVLPLGDVSVQ